MLHRCRKSLVFVGCTAWGSVPSGLAFITVTLCALVMSCRLLPTSMRAASGASPSQQHPRQRLRRRPLRVALRLTSPQLSEGPTLEQSRLFEVLLSVCVTKNFASFTDSESRCDENPLELHSFGAAFACQCTLRWGLHLCMACCLWCRTSS